MWLLEFTFFALTLTIGWTLFGYLLLIWFVGLFNKCQKPEFPEDWPAISIIVPCYNEEEQIIEKLDDIRALDYPAEKMEVIFADGGSQDETCSLLEANLKDGEPIRLIRCPEKGKTNQINFVLPLLNGEIVFNTDTDSRISEDSMKWMVAEMTSNENVWVVGAYCKPDDTGLDIEQYHWDSQNKARFIESDARTTSIVIAQCYAFRRKMINSFPKDVVADDIYVAQLANVRGKRSVYSRWAKAIETRNPKSYNEFFSHKFRKSNAYLRESLRFLYRLPEMRMFCKVMYITKIMQQLLLPWTMMFWFLLAGVLITLFQFDVVVFGMLFLIVLLFMTNRVFASVSLPDEESKLPFITMLKNYIILNIILLTTGLSYPFFIQESSYTRINASNHDDADIETKKAAS